MVNLRWFRRHQKVMLVVFGVVLMAVFVLGSVLDYVMGRGGRGGGQASNWNTTVVQWKGGSLNRGQLERLKHLHFATVRFQDQLMRFAQSNPAWRGPMAERIQPVGNPGNSVQSEEIDRAIFGRFMLAEFARQEMDMTLGRDAVLEYINLLTDQSLSDQQLYTINYNANGDNVDYRDILDYMKLELMAMRVDDLLGVSLPFAGLQNNFTGSVLDQFLAFLQTEKRFECAVVPLKIEDFEAQVKGDPSPAKLREIFDEGKYNEPSFFTDRPAFKKPRKVAVQYLEADREAFLERAIQDVTKEQVIAEYDRLVAAKDPLVMEPVPAAEKANEPGERLEDPAPMPTPEKTDKSGEDPAPPPPATEGKAGETTPAKDDAGSKTEDQPAAAESKQAEEKSTESEPAKDPADPGKANDESAPTDGDGQSTVRGPGLFQPVAYRSSAGIRQDEKPADPKPQEDAPKPDAPTQEPSPAAESVKADSTPQEDSQPQETKPAESAGGDSQPQDSVPEQQPANQEAAPTTPPVNQQENAAPTPLVPPVAQEPQLRPKKLDEALERVIKQRMKRAEADKAFRAAVEEARIKMSAYHVALSSYEASLEIPGEEPIEKPKMIDLQQIADQLHMTYGSTGLLSFRELNETPFGQVSRFSVDPRTQRLVPSRLSEVIFESYDQLALFAPETFAENYVYWLTEKADARIPSIEEVRNEVIEYWKDRQAIDLAVADAKQKVESLAKSGVSLTESYPEKAKLTGEFGWFSSTSPLEVERPGDDFFSTAYGLKQGEIGFAKNETETYVYLIQKVKADPRTDDAIRDQFLKQLATFKQPWPNNVMPYYAQQAAQQWIRDINEILGVEWIAY